MGVWGLGIARILAVDVHYLTDFTQRSRNCWVIIRHAGRNLLYSTDNGAVVTIAEAFTDLRE